MTAFIEGSVQTPTGRNATRPSCPGGSVRPTPGGLGHSVGGIAGGPSKPIGLEGPRLVGGYDTTAMSHSRRYSSHACPRRRLRITKLRSMLRSRLSTSSHSSSRVS